MTPVQAPVARAVVAWSDIAIRTPSVGTISSARPTVRPNEPPRTRALRTFGQPYVLPVQYLETVWVQPAMRGSVKMTSPLVRLVVTDEDGDGVFVASDSFSTVYGAGPTPDEAIQEYASNLFEQFDELDANEAELGMALRAELAELRRHFVRIR